MRKLAVLGAFVALGTLASVGPTFAQDDGGGASDSGAAATSDSASDTAVAPALPAADPALTTLDPLLTTQDPFAPGTAESYEGGLAGPTVAPAGPVYAVGGIR